LKISIITAILNSPEIVRRQILHYRKLNLPDDIEIIFVDDGSDPPLEDPGNLANFRLLYTHDFRHWTQPAARNFGVKQAVGKYIIVTDIDHILSRDLIDTVYSEIYDVLRFQREVGVLDENGDFSQDFEKIAAWGFPLDRLHRKGLHISPHTNSFAMTRNLYWKFGGVSEKHVGSGKHPNREEQPVKRRWKKYWKQGRIRMTEDDDRPVIYAIPNGRFCGHKDTNPFGYFHSLERKTR